MQGGSGLHNPPVSKARALDITFGKERLFFRLILGLALGLGLFFHEFEGLCSELCIHRDCSPSRQLGGREQEKRALTPLHTDRCVGGGREKTTMPPIRRLGWFLLLKALSFHRSPFTKRVKKGVKAEIKVTSVSVFPTTSVEAGKTQEHDRRCHTKKAVCNTVTGDMER